MLNMIIPNAAANPNRINPLTSECRSKRSPIPPAIARIAKAANTCHRLEGYPDKILG